LVYRVRVGGGPPREARRGPRPTGLVGGDRLVTVCLRTFAVTFGTPPDQPQLPICDITPPDGRAEGRPEGHPEGRPVTFCMLRV